MHSNWLTPYPRYNLLPISPSSRQGGVVTTSSILAVGQSPIVKMQTPNRPSMNSTPPSSARRQGNSDRFIPSRVTTNLDDAFDILENKMNHRENMHDQNIHESQALMNNLLRSELLGQTSVLEQIHGFDGSSSSRSSDAHFKSPPRKESTSVGSSSNLFKYRPSPSSLSGKMSLESKLSSASDLDNLSTISSPGRRTLSIGGSPMAGPKPLRKIPKAPFKILDAPSLQDDYYLNLLDWSANNVLAVALCNSVYLWSAYTSKVVKLCEYEADSETVTSIAWSISHPQYISVGTSQGRIQVWDSVAGTIVRELKKHEARVGALAWNSSLLASGSRDRTICVQDIRMCVHGHGSSNSSHGGSTRRHSLGGSGSHAPDSKKPKNDSSPPGTMGAMALSTPPRPTASSAAAVHAPPPPSFPELREAASSQIDDSVQKVLAAAEDAQVNMSLFSSTSSRLEAMRSVFSPLPPPSLPGSSPQTTVLFASPARNSSSATMSGPNGASGGSSGVVKELRGHRQEVCGLKWSFDEKMLASGGNDNKLLVWEPAQQSCDPVHRFEDHTAAVKAVAWSPHQAGLLASGGGTADRHIRFWNASTGLPLHKIDTGSQVCLSDSGPRRASLMSVSLCRCAT